MAVKLTFRIEENDMAIDLSKALSLKLGDTIMQGGVFNISKLAWRGDDDADTNLCVGHVPASDNLVFAWKEAFNAFNNTNEFRQLMEKPGEFSVGWNTSSLFTASGGSDFSHVDPVRWATLDGRPTYGVCAPPTDHCLTVVADAEGSEWNVRFGLLGMSGKYGVTTADGVGAGSIPAGWATVGLIDMFNSANPIDYAGSVSGNPEVDAWGSPIPNDTKPLTRIWHACEHTIVPNRNNHGSATAVDAPTNAVSEVGLQGDILRVMCGLLRITNISPNSATGFPLWGTYTAGTESASPDDGVLDFVAAYDVAQGDSEGVHGYLDIWVDSWSEF